MAERGWPTGEEMMATLQRWEAERVARRAANRRTIPEPAGASSLAGEARRWPVEQLLRVMEPGGARPARPPRKPSWRHPPPRGGRCGRLPSRRPRAVDVDAELAQDLEASALLVCRHRKALIVFEDGFRMIAPAQGLRRLTR